jgi:hypothetical protein
MNDLRRAKKKSTAFFCSASRNFAGLTITGTACHENW